MNDYNGTYADVQCAGDAALLEQVQISPVAEGSLGCTYETAIFILQSLEDAAACYDSFPCSSAGMQQQQCILSCGRGFRYLLTRAATIFLIWLQNTQ